MGPKWNKQLNLLNWLGDRRQTSYRAMYRRSRGRSDCRKPVHLFLPPRTTWNKSSWLSEQHLNSGPPNFKSGVATTRPCCFLIEAARAIGPIISVKDILLTRYSKQSINRDQALHFGLPITYQHFNQTSWPHEGRQLIVKVKISLEKKTFNTSIN